VASPGHPSEDIIDESLKRNILILSFKV